VSRFLTDAEEILKVAAGRTDRDAMPDEMAILVDDNGTIRMLDASGWEIESLRANFGASTAYKVVAREGLTRLEGRSSTQRCVLEVASPQNIARTLLGPSWYSTASSLGPHLLQSPQPA